MFGIHVLMFGSLFSVVAVVRHPLCSSDWVHYSFMVLYYWSFSWWRF